MKRTKMLAAGMALAMMASSVFAAPKQEGNIKKIKPKAPVTLDVYSQLANYSGIQEGWFADLILQKFNVKLNIIPETGGAYQTRMESGNLGDLVVWGNDGEQYINAVNAGLLYDWNQDKLVQNYGPYIAANMKHALQKNKFTSKTGKIYGFGHNVSTSSKDIQAFFYTWDLRYDLYEKIGKPKIDDLYDMIDVLAKMKKVCPKDDNGNPTYGVSIFNDWDGNMVMFVKALATAYFGYDEFDFGLYDPETGTFHGCLEENGPYFYTLKFFNKLMQKGLVDPDSLTQKYNGMSEDYQNGTAFWNIFNWMASGTYNTEAHLAAGKGMYPVVPAKARPIVYGQSVYGGERIWSIGADTKYPELCMAIINWLSTPEGFLTSQYGPRGVTWDISKDKKPYLTDFGKIALADQAGTQMKAPYKGTYKDGSFQINNTTWGLDAANPMTPGELYNRETWASEQVAAKSACEASWREWSGATTPQKYMEKTNYMVAPGTMFSHDPTPKDLSLAWSQVGECIRNGSWKAIYASSDKEFDACVAEMVKQAKEYGYDDCCAFTVEQAKKRAAAEKAVR